MSPCPVCRMPLMSEPRAREDRKAFNCYNCGSFELSGSAEAMLDGTGFSPLERSKISFGIRRGDGFVTAEALTSFVDFLTLPSATDLVDNLLLHVATELDAPGESMDLWAPALRASLGSHSAASAQWVIEQSVGGGLIEGTKSKSIGGPDEFRLLRATLTLRGWDRVSTLLKNAKDSKKAFMAMKFGDEVLDAVFRDHFKPAVKETGFDLLRLDEEPSAGLIDDRLRLELRTSRFVIADLSHGNNGAYWEAGFAEGMGRPVIYTCRKDVFDNELSRPHFDTNHYLTVVWDAEQPHLAAEQLKTIIRVTLPSDAILAD